ncbi:MAG: hypothetical protein UW95_C0003G0017 [Parcubacteria group bacterium GW2011_GWC1_45_14]|nr:MAG: hypothetical protein UW87_C0002G0004 [Candidatus Moranbacteria bacterium GW2011_GWC2_45_10]KKT95175.1 MAG: hypothetical protein UW95_C0003G0017 [Parcubacteria group bacterium GW2011_GWC1_45_14]
MAQTGPKKQKYGNRKYSAGIALHLGPGGLRGIWRRGRLCDRIRVLSSIFAADFWRKNQNKWEEEKKRILKKR